MPRRLLADHLAVEGVDEFALIDILQGVAELSSTLDALPHAVKSVLLADFDNKLSQSRLSMPPLGKFVIQATINGMRDPASFGRLEEELRHTASLHTRYRHR